MLEASRPAWMLIEERLLATTTRNAIESDMINNVEHKVNPQLTTKSEDEVKVWGYMMIQCSLKAGLQKFGEKGTTAAMQELAQLHVVDTWKAMDPMKLSQEEQMRALSLLLFLKEKQIGKVKGWACLNGAPQRAYIPKEDTVLLTVSTESTFITAAIAASERQTIQCCDVPSVFVNTDVNKDILMVLKGELADMMIQKKEILQAQEAQ